MSCCIAVVMLASCSPAAVKEEAAIPPVEEEEVAPSTKPTPPIPEPAKFEVISLDIKPPEATAGQTVSITAVVENTGDSEGTYNVILTVESVTIEAKEVTITPGSSKEVTFSLVKDIPGTYEIVIGGLSSTLTVKEKIVVKKKLVAKEIELKYDDGEVDDGVFLSAGGGGYLIGFSPPDIPFTLKKIRIFGKLTGSGWEGKSFEVELRTKIGGKFYSTTCPVTMFPVEVPAWVEIEIPDIDIPTQKFAVHVYTGTGLNKGIALGVDNSVTNENSERTIRTEEGETQKLFYWPYKSKRHPWVEDKSNVNWMIRVVGTIMVSASIPSPITSRTATVEINTANGTWRELFAEAALKKLLAEYDVSKWIFTREILIEEGGIPHSRPILTITPRNLYLYDELVFLSTFLHEQICWFLYPDRNYEVNRAIGELRQLYPEVPVGGTEGGIDENSTYRHLIANFLEFSAMVELVGEELAVATMERKDHYTWTYETVLSDAVKIEEIAQKYGLIIE